MIYTIVHTVINNKGKNDEANARVIGAYSDRNVAIKQAETWIKNTTTSDVKVVRVTDTQWHFWFEENGITYGGYVEVHGVELDKEI